MIESIFGLPGGKRMNSSDVSPLSELGGEQSVTVHTWVSTTAGFCATVCVVSFGVAARREVELRAERELRGDVGEGHHRGLVGESRAVDLDRRAAGVGAGGLPEVGPAVATTLVTVGTPAYVAFT